MLRRPLATPGSRRASAKNRAETGTTRWRPPLPSATNSRRSPALTILQAQAEHLAAAQPAQHHRLDHGPVAVGAQRRPTARRPRPARSTRGSVRGVRISGTPPWPRRAPGRRAARLAWHRVAVHAGVAPGRQVGVQAPHARQPPGDRACRQARLAVLQPHDPLPVTRSTLGRQESEHVRGGHLRRRLTRRPRRRPSDPTPRPATCWSVARTATNAR